MEEKLNKMTVECNSLHFRTGIHAKGQVIEATDDEAMELMKDGNASPAPDNAVVSVGVPKVMDPIERDLREGKFKEIRESGAIQPPAGAEKLPTPPVGPGPAPRDYADIKPIPKG